MILKRRCCRKVPFLNDSAGLVVLASCLIGVAIYYVSTPFDESNNKSDVTRAQKHLREIVKLDQEKNRLSLQIDEYDDE